MRRFRVFKKLLSYWAIVLFAVIFSDAARCVDAITITASSPRTGSIEIKIARMGVERLYTGWRAKALMLPVLMVAAFLPDAAEDPLVSMGRSVLAGTGVLFVTVQLGICAYFIDISAPSGAPECLDAGGGVELLPDNSSTSIPFINSSIFIPIAEANQIDKKHLLDLINVPENGEHHTDNELGAGEIIHSSGIPSLIASELTPAYQESGSEQAKHHFFVLSKDSIGAEKMELRGLTKADADSILKFNTFLHSESKIDSVENVHDFSDFLTDQINDYSKMITDEHYKGCALFFIIRNDSAQTVFIPFS